MSVLVWCEGVCVFVFVCVCVHEWNTVECSADVSFLTVSIYKAWEQAPDLQSAATRLVPINTHTHAHAHAHTFIFCDFPAILAIAVYKDVSRFSFTHLVTK